MRAKRKKCDAPIKEQSHISCVPLLLFHCVPYQSLAFTNAYNNPKLMGYNYNSKMCAQNLKKKKPTESRKQKLH